MPSPNAFVDRLLSSWRPQLQAPVGGIVTNVLRQGVTRYILPAGRFLIGPICWRPVSLRPRARSHFQEIARCLTSTCPTPWTERLARIPPKSPAVASSSAASTDLRSRIPGTQADLAVFRAGLGAPAEKWRGSFENIEDVFLWPRSRPARVALWMRCAEDGRGKRTSCGPRSFEDFEDGFPRLLVRARPGGVLRILRMRLRRVPSLKAGTLKGGWSSYEGRPHSED